MSSPWPVILAVLALGAIYVLLPVALTTFRRLRSLPGLWCPLAQVNAGVVVDARRGALTSALGRPQLRVTDCSLWPARKGCGEDCLKGLRV